MNLLVILICFAAGFVACDGTLSPFKDTILMRLWRKKSHAAIFWIALMLLGRWLLPSQWGIVAFFFGMGGFMHIITDFLPMFSKRCLRCNKRIKKGDFCIDCRMRYEKAPHDG